MISSFEHSQPYVQKALPGLPGSKSVKLVSTNAVGQDSQLIWGVERIDLLLSAYFNKKDRGFDAVWGIEDDDSPGASIWGHVSPCVMLITSGAIRYICEARTMLDRPGTGFAKDFLFPAVEGHNQTVLAKHVGENLAMFSLMGLLAHEVGHVVDRQFESPPLVTPSSLLDRSFEIAADTFAIHMCCEFAWRWADDAAMRVDRPMTAILRSGLFYTMVGYGLIAPVDWQKPWLPFSLSTAKHPPEALRFLSAAVAMSEWFVANKVLDEKDAGQMAVEVFTVAAQTLYWHQYKREIPADIFLRLALYKAGNDSSVAAMRKAYENFQQALPATAS